MKRILLVDHPQFTSATYFLWQGLKELERKYSDKLSVLVYPFIPTHFDEQTVDYKTMSWFLELDRLCEESKRTHAPLGQGIPPMHETERLMSMNETVIHRGFPWCTFPKDNNLLTDENQAIQAINAGAFDVVILGNSHRVPTILLARLKERVRVPFPPVIYFDAGERDELNEHWVHVFRPALTFKQILTPDVKAKGLTVQIPGYDFKIYPLPLSSPIVDNDVVVNGLSLQWLRERSKTAHKMLQVFYSMSNTWDARAEIVRAMDEIVIQRDLSRVKGAHYLEYHFCLATSRMAITMRGSGRDTTRYWEIPLYKTAMVADGTMGCIHPYPFEHLKTALFYTSLQHLIELMKTRIDLAADVEAIGTAGQEHLEKYHSVAARAVFFLDILNQELNFYDGGLKEATDNWKWRRKWDGRPWEGPVA
jgi:Glycosyl transferases group 1